MSGNYAAGTTIPAPLAWDAASIRRDVIRWLYGGIAPKPTGINEIVAAQKIGVSRHLYGVPCPMPELLPALERGR